MIHIPFAGGRGSDYNAQTMKTSWIPTVVPTGLAIVGLCLVALWISAPGTASPAARMPGMDDTPKSVAPAAARTTLAGKPVRGDGQPADIPSAWSGFRGSRRDAICDDGTPLARSWPPSGPPKLWQIAVGEGYASAAIGAGRVFVLDYDERAQADTLRCLGLTDGREIWRNSYPAQVARNHGMSRTIPAIAGDLVVSIGPRCHVACWDAKTGECRWITDMVQQFGTEERPWYTGQCPLVDGDRVILAPCGRDTLLVALDLRNGQVVWRTPNPRAWKMTHSSIMPMEFAGQKMYVYCGTGGTVGVSAVDGKLLWDETTWVENFATSPSPVAVPEGRIFLCSGYDMIGAKMLQVKQADGKFAVESAFEMKRKEFNAEQQTPIYYHGHLYGVRKLRGQMICMDLNGNELWNSGELKFGHGPFLIADGLLFALAEDGLLATMEATHEGYRPLAQFQVLEDGHEAWGPMAIAAGYLIVRDLTRMACFDVRK
jgi:outer membrane protein assembly factor BamB